MAEPVRRSRFARFSRGVAWTLLSLLLGVVLLVLLAVVILFTTPGQTALRKFALGKVNASIAGKVELGKLDLDVGGWIRLRDLRILDPQGRVVVSAELVAAHVDPLALTLHRIWLKDIQVERPQVLLVQTPEGTNLSAALQPRHPQPAQPKQPSTGAPWRIELDRLAVRNGLVDKRKSADDPDALHVQDITLGGSAVDVPGRVVAELHGAAVVTSPEQTPLGFDVTATGTGTTLDDALTLKQLEVVAGRSVLKASGGIQDHVAQGKLSVRLDEHLGRALGAPLAHDLSVDAEGTWVKGGDAVVDAAVPETTGGAAYLHAVVAPEATPLAYSGNLKLEHFDPAALVTDAPPGDLNGTATVAGHGTRLQELVADLSAKLAPSTIRGVKVSALALRGSAVDGRLELPELALTLPGGRLTGHGSASLSALNLQLEVAAPDLKALTSNLGMAEPYEGAGRASIHVGGSVKAPSATVALQASRFANPALNLDLRSATVNATIADLRKPTQLEAQVHVAQGSYQGETFHGFGGKVALGGGRFDANLQSEGANGISLRATGELPDSHHQLVVSSLDVGQGGAAWTLVGPSRIQLANGPRVDQLELRSGKQRIVVLGGLTGRRLRAHLELHDVDLAHLPKIVVPERLGLSGVVSGSADATGTRANPHVEANLDATGLGAAALARRTGQKVDLKVQTTLADHRARGHAEAKFAGETAAVVFDAPISNKAASSAPLALSLKARDVELARLADLLNVPPEALAGRISLDAQVQGTLAHPTGTVALTLDGVSFRKTPPLTGKATLDLDHQAQLAVDLHVPEGALAGKASLDLPEDLLRHPERAKGLRTQPAHVDLTLRDLRLDPWRALFGIPPDASGILGARLLADGSAADPRGTLHLDVRRLVYGKYKDLTAVADVGAGDALTVRGALALHGRTAGHLDARLGSTVAALIQAPSRAGSTPVTLTAELGPLDLADAQGPGATAHGVADVLAELRGTLDHPVLHAHASGRGLSFSSTPLGETDAAVVYQDGKLQVVANLDHFHLQALAEQDLGLQALRAGLNVRTIPLDVTLRADGFELASLSGVSESVSTLGGQLTADAHLTGSIADPTFRGQLGIVSGRMVLAGFGDFHDIAMKLTADNRNIQLSQCEIHSAGGWARITASATRAADTGPFDLTGEVHSDKFPVESEDQTLAHVQADAKLDGEVGGRDSLVNVRFSKVHADVPKLTHKDVQPLGANPDIVVLGRTEKAKKPLEAGAALSGTEQPGATTSPTPAPTPSAAAPGIQVRLGIFAPSDFWLRGQDINVEVHAALGLRIRPGADPVMEMIPPPGHNEASYVEVARGYLSVMGRRFDVDETKPPKLTFEGGPPSNAQLNASVVYNDRQDNILVTVTITGPVTKPNPPTLTSQPPMDQSQLALLIATGHLTAKRGAGAVSATSQAGSVVGAFLAGQLQQTMAKTLPIDTITVQTGSQGEISAEVGKYITDKIYVGYTRNFASQLSPGSLENQDQNINEVTLQYQLTPHWQLEAVGGETQGGIDAVWQKDY